LRAQAHVRRRLKQNSPRAAMTPNCPGLASRVTLPNGFGASCLSGRFFQCDDGA
jgi:hypothetical protein